VIMMCTGHRGKIRITLLWSLLFGLMLFSSVWGDGIEEKVSFKVTFEGGFQPDLSINEVKVTAKGAELVSGKVGKAVRIGRKGEKWYTMFYYLPQEAILAEKFHQKTPVFPLQEGTLEFDFRPSGWEIGSEGEFALLHIHGKKGGTLYIRYQFFKEIPYIQVIYGVLYEQYTEKGKRQWIFLSTEIPKKEKQHWYHVTVAWNRKKIELSVDGIKKSNSLAKITIPRYNGFRLDLGIPFPSQKDVQIEGFTDIDNLVISNKGPDENVVTEEHFPKVVIGRCSGEMKIDGWLNEPSWQEATLITGFMDITHNNYSVHQPRVYLTYDKRYLYIGVKSPVYSSTVLTAQATDRDSPVWKDDCIEVFLDPTPETIDYYQFVFNSRGAIFDQICNFKNQSKKNNLAWNIKGIKVGTNTTKSEWILELAFPYEGLGVKGIPEGESWLFNICETRIGVGAYSICALHTYHEREKFGVLLFRSDLPRIRMEDLGSIKSGMANFLLSYVSSEDKKVEILVTGKRFDETAGTFFALFSESATIGKKSKSVFRADESKLRKSGVLDIKVVSGADRIYEGRIGYELALKPEIETMRVIKKTEGRELKVRVSLPFVKGRGDKVQVKILDEGLNEVKKSEVVDVNSNKMDVYVSLTGVPIGKYKVCLELLRGDGSVEKAKEMRDFIVYSDPPPWHDNKLGISDKVPVPWTPVKVVKKEGRIVVTCWNREYYFGRKSLLPEQILSGGRNYLKTPITVVLSSDGYRINTGNVKHRVVKKNERSCQIQSSCHTDWGNLQTETTVEFDGFIWVDLTLKPHRKARLDNLKVVWEMPLERSRLLHSGYRSLVNVGRTPETWHKCLNQQAGPFWIGDENGGISFAVESFKGWSNKKVDHQAELKVLKASTRININIVDKPININREITYGFCFHPTPVRPRPHGYRKVRMMSWGCKLRHGITYPITLSPWNCTPKYQGSPEWCTTDEEIRWYCRVTNRKFAPFWTYRGLKESGVRSTWYAGYSYTGRNSPECIWAGEDWRAGEKDQLYGGSLYGYYRDMIAVCKTKDYCDYFLWRLDKSKKEHPIIDGIYLDLIGWPACTRKDHGHGYVDEQGRRHPTWEIREHRQWLLRIYTYLKEKDPETPILLHLSGQMPKIMGYSFCDYLWTGEMWLEELKRDRSYKNLSLDTFRTEALGQIWGPAVFWISELKSALAFLPPEERKLEPWAYRHIMGLMLTHDTLPTYAGLRLRDYLPIWKALDRFGLDDTDQFLPYWQQNTGIELEPKSNNLVATAYVKPNRALVVLFNNTDNDLNVSVKISSQKLFGKVSKLQINDAETNEKLAAGGMFNLLVGKRNFRLLIVNVK